MDEQLSLETLDFEFTVWANDTRARARVYHDTLKKRAGFANANSGLDVKPIVNLASAPELRFSPQIELADSGEKYSVISLNTPLFYENTLYQFEWTFVEAVSHAAINHKSKAISEAFCFDAERKRRPARLIGSIQTGNNVGWMSLPLSFEVNGQVHTQHIAFEVLPTKMALHQDLPAMYKAIDEVYPLWRFSLVEKTAQNAAKSKHRGHFPLMWLANFGDLRDRFEQGLNVISAAPHSCLQPTVAHTKAAKLKGRLPHRLGQQVKQDFASGQYEKRYRVEKKQLSVDTPENRFIKRVVSQCKKQLADFESKLRTSNQAPDKQRLSDSFLDELHRWQQPLQKMLNQSFLKDVGQFTGQSRESLVLQQKTGYSAVYRVWQELKFYLDVFGDQSSISMKSVADIYEVWCFLQVKNILENDLGFELAASKTTKLTQNDFFEYRMEDGFAGAFKFTRSDGVSARLAHEPKFTKKGQSIRSYLVNQEPDIVLEVTLPRSTHSAEEKKFIWVFDAKYRIKTNKNRFDENLTEDLLKTDYVPDDAINQMHRYRDALIQLSSDKRSKSRPVFGAFALYPGFFDQENEANPYASSIEEISIGAFALLPTQVGGAIKGQKWLVDFLRDQIGMAPTTKATATAYGDEMAERLYVQEAARIPYNGMRQVLYPDLTMTVALGGKAGRESQYFEGFKQGTAQWYHIPEKTFLKQFKQHVAEEIRYLALAVTSDTHSSTKQIDKLWPVKKVVILPRYAITEQQAGKGSTATDMYYLFELGRPLTLQAAVTGVPHRPVKNTMKLTTLTRLENVDLFSKVDKVYEKALP